MRISSSLLYTTQSGHSEWSQHLITSESSLHSCIPPLSLHFIILNGNLSRLFFLHYFNRIFLLSFLFNLGICRSHVNIRKSLAPSITCLILILAFVGCINCILKCFDHCGRPSSSPSQITTIPIVTTTVESAVPMVPITPSAPDDTTITTPETDQYSKQDEPPKYDQLPENDQPPNYDECVRANCVNINSLEFV